MSRTSKPHSETPEHSDAALLLSHNPDYVEQIRDPRVGLVLSGHTHGGQVVLPFAGAPFVPSLYGREVPARPGPHPDDPGLRVERHRHRHAARALPLSPGDRADLPLLTEHAQGDRRYIDLGRPRKGASGDHGQGREGPTGEDRSVVSA